MAPSALKTLAGTSSVLIGTSGASLAGRYSAPKHLCVLLATSLPSGSGMAVRHHLDEARFAPDVFHAYLDVVNHEPAKPPYHGHGPLGILAFPVGNQ